MTFSIPPSRGLLTTCIIALLTVSANAQSGNAGAQLPNISKVCLWNGHRAMWKELGLKKKQIARLGELRAKYPAVVDGQWIRTDEETAVVPPEQNWVRADPNTGASSSGHGANAATPVAVSMPLAPAPTAVPEGMQSELREVLSPEQLRNWARLCAM